MKKVIFFSIFIMLTCLNYSSLLAQPFLVVKQGCIYQVGNNSADRNDMDSWKGKNECFTPFDGSRMLEKSCLLRGEYLFYVSPEYMGVYEYDQRKGGWPKTVWSIRFTKNIDCLRVQSDGNLVAYAPGGEAVWASNTAGRGGGSTYLTIQEDGNLVLYNGTWTGMGQGDAIWATGTCGGVKNGCGSVGPR
jgi:hypothetical protein